MSEKDCEKNNVHKGKEKRTTTKKCAFPKCYEEDVEYVEITMGDLSLLIPYCRRHAKIKREIIEGKDPYGKIEIEF